MIGERLSDLLAVRSGLRDRKITRSDILKFIHTHLWNYLFAKDADLIEKSAKNDNECKYT